MKKSNKLSLLLVPLLVVLSLYISGYITQFIRNYNEWKLEYGLASGVSPKLPSGDFMTCVKVTFSSDGLNGIMIIGIIIGLIIFYIVFVGKGQKGTTDRKRNIVYSDSGNYGTAGFMTEEEFSSVLECCSPKNATGIILGSPIDCPKSKSSAPHPGAI